MKNPKPGFYRELLLLAIPVSIQSVLISVLNVADVMMVGALGQQAVAAVGLAAKLHFVTLLLIFGFSNASGVLVSQYLGANQRQRIKRVVLITVFSGSAILLPIAFLFGINPTSWLVLVNNDSNVVALTAEYLTITAPVVVLMVVIMTIQHSLRSLGQAVVPMVFSAISIAVNIALNYALIFGNWGAPAMGVAGAAWATLIARLIELGLLFIYLYGTRHFLSIYTKDFSGLSTVKTWTSYWKFALPVALNFVLWGFGSSIYHLIASQMGTQPLAVMSVLAPIESIVISIFMGISSAASIFLGRALGANNFDYAWQLKIFFVRYAVLFAFFAGALMWLSKPLLLMPFGELEPETLRMLDYAYLIMCALIWVKIHNMMSMVSVLRAGGDTVWCLKIDIVSMWMISIPATAFAGLVLELPFVWVFLILYSEEIVKMAASHWRMWQKQWLRNLTDIVHTEAASRG